MSHSIATIAFVTLLAGASSNQHSSSPAKPIPAGTGEPASLAFGDFDGDRLLDALAIGPEGTLRLLKNLGDGTFDDVSAFAGMSAVRGASLALWEDYDKDGWPDLFVGTSCGPRHLFRNRGNGLFEDVTRESGLGRESCGERLAQWMDYDQDGRLDLHVEGAAGGRLYHALADGSFEELVLSIAQGTPSVTKVIVSHASHPSSANDPDEKEANPRSEPAANDGRGDSVSSSASSSDSPRAPIATTTIGLPTSGVTQSMQIVPTCIVSIRDQANPGTCLKATSVPTPGMLFPPPHDGGVNNVVSGTNSFMGGGQDNQATNGGGYYGALGHTTVGGGRFNTASGNYATVGGGGGLDYYAVESGNTASGDFTTVGGGAGNTAAGRSATVGGGRYNAASSPGSTVCGGYRNTASGSAGATIGGGGGNVASGEFATIAGGNGNTASGYYHATVGGGVGNIASGTSASVGGGGYLTFYFGLPIHSRNIASGHFSTVGGGGGNTASGDGATVAGGGRPAPANFLAPPAAPNVASGDYASVGGGIGNTAAGQDSAVPGGQRNTALGDYTFAAGRRAKADHAGAFVWGDSQDVDKASSAADEFNVYASGGVRMFSNAAATAGVLLAPGGGSWSSVSDRTSKENIEPIDARAVLERVCALPISTWNYEAQDDSIRHMGPMAQDFHAAFGLGVSDKMIDTIDPDGVALAAIQGLNARMDELVIAKNAEIAELRERVARLESVERELSSLRTTLQMLIERR